MFNPQGSAAIALEPEINPQACNCTCVLGGAGSGNCLCVNSVGAGRS